jgi:hypothetical protein
VVTHFDSKIFKAIALLFTRPGFLTREFSAGKINSFIKPFTLFLLLNAFFFFLGHGFLNIKDADYTYYAQRHPKTENVLQQYKLSHNTSEAAVVQKFNALKEGYQKMIYFIIIPLFGVGLHLIFARRGRLLTESVVHAIHTFSWYILTLMIVVPVMFVIQYIFNVRQQSFEILLLCVLFILALIYNYLSVRTIFFLKVWPSMIYALVMTSLMMYLDSLFSGWLIYQFTMMHFRF